MKIARRIVRFVFIFLCALLLFYLISLCSQIPDYTIGKHAFKFHLLSFVGTTVAAFAFLFALWFWHSKFMSRRFKMELARTQDWDVLSYVPLLFFTLLPLAGSRYVTADDLGARVRLFALAVILGVLYLKLFTGYRFDPEGRSLFHNVWKKIAALSLKKKLVILFLLALLVFNIGSVFMIAGGITFSGDEPHYLLITHSLLKDGDFNLANNYENKDYRAYMPEEVQLDIHLAPGTGGHSYHSPGISLFLLPFYALGTLFSKAAILYCVRFGMSVFGALLGLQIFLYVWQEWKKEKLALLLWLLFCFTSPIFFYSLHIYPEVILALFSLTIFRLLRFSNPLTKSKLVSLGLLLGCFIWLHAVKYMFILIPFFLYILWTLNRERKVGWNILYFLAFPLILFLLHTLFSFTLYGSLSPFAVSLKGTTSSEESLSLLKEVFSDVAMKNRLETLVGYFFDQRDGLLLYAPIYAFGFLGMIEMGRRNIKKLFILLFLAAPYVLGLAFLTQRAAYAPQARTQVAVFWVMGIFVGYFLAFNAKKIFFYLFSAAAAFSYVVVFVLLKNPWALYQPTTFGEAERAGQLFIHLSNLHFYLPQFLPSFLKMDNRSWLPNYLWLGFFILFCAAYVVLKKHNFRPKLALHVGLVCLTLGIVFVWGVLYPRLVLLEPENIELPTGEKLTFYSLGRVLRMPEPGLFQLPRGDRSYIFHFTSWRPIDSLQIEFGSPHGTFTVNIRYFDMPLFDGLVVEEEKTVRVAEAFSYRFKKRYLYRISIELKRESGLLAYSHPFLFKISGS
jgi:hypothetical protein